MKTWFNMSASIVAAYCSQAATLIDFSGIDPSGLEGTDTSGLTPFIDTTYFDFVYVAFGRAMGYMHSAWVDVQGAGAQRSDPKSGDPGDFPTGHGPQGDAIRIYNYVRMVRDAA